MNEIIKLTEKEIAFMKLTLNYKTREEQLSDNYSCAGLEEAKEAFNWNDHQVGGLFSSLIKKGLGDCDDESYDIFWLSEDGINTIFDIIENEIKEVLK